MDAGRCKQLASLKADLNMIPKSKSRKEKGQDGQWYYEIWFQVRMISNLANITFKLVHDDVEYGKVDVVWDTS